VWNAHPRFGPNLCVKPVWGARAFIPKNEAIFIRKRSIPKPAGCLCREEPETPRSLCALSKILPVSMLMDVQGSPIVHAGATKVSIIDDITQRMNQMQPGLRQCTHPPDVAGILGNFRLEKDNVNHRDRQIRMQAGSALKRQPE